jgi:thiol-disulfide isomerase/thioredoxin
MNSIQFRPKWFLVGAAFLGLASAALAEENKTSEAAAAYSALLKRADSRPTDVPEATWHQTMAAELEQFALKFAGQPEAAEARRDRLQQLQDAARKDPTLKPAFLAASTAVWKDAQVDPDERANARRIQLLLEYNDSVPVGELLDLWKEFPGSESVATDLANQVTETVDADLRQKMLLALRDTPGASEKRRTFASKILSGEVKPLSVRVGQPLQLQFKAVDGRDVDVQKLRGKVVLIDFWATWCGPCIEEMPQIKKLYEENHDKGFEIVGISFDQQKPKLEGYLKKEGITWPQYFDGKASGNGIGKDFAIRVLPTVALVDKAGLLRFVNAQHDFADKVKQLLAQ